MKILSIQALRGPNYWSTDFPKLIQLRIDMGVDITLDQAQWKKIIHVLELAQIEIPNLNEIDIEEKTVISIAAIALAVQKIANKDLDLTYFEWKKTAIPHTYNIVFQYAYEQAGKQAAKSAVHLLQKITTNQAFDLDAESINIRALLFEETPKAKLLHLLKELANRPDIPVISKSSLGPWQLGHGKKGIQLDEDKLPESVAQLFTEVENGSIPIFSITGSNGKTTTTRLVAHILKSAGYKPGYTTSDGIYIDGQIIDKGDTTGPASAELTLRNTSIDVAVLETARGGIVRAGLGFNHCNISIVTNVQEDHLGISDINTMDELARIKSVIINATYSLGNTVLNADNTYTIAMGKTAKCLVNWFAMSANNLEIKNAINQKQTVAYIENHCIVIETPNQKLNIANLDDVPITFNGTLKFMTQNALAAVLAVYLFGLNKTVIANGLKTFLPSPELTPGRMNIYDFPHCKLLVDFAHNPDGFLGIQDFMKPIQASKKIGIIVGTGDRRPEDVIALGKISAQMFDHILIHQVKFLRGKTAEELIDQLTTGIKDGNTNTTWERVPDEIEPLKYALSIAPKDSYIVALSDVLHNPIELVDKYKRETF